MEGQGQGQGQGQGCVGGRGSLSSSDKNWQFHTVQNSGDNEISEVGLYCYYIK